ncbi:MAG: spore protease YyaC [Clostridiales bacterium]|nr:spore protease YyaC [Clostridiales bacterium]
MIKCAYTKEYKKVVILCIGSDRATGDCLGPLVGHKLRLIKYKDVSIYGTLDEPVHAKNLEEVQKSIQRLYDRPFIIAIDASLGSTNNVGHINLGFGPLLPGAGVYKNLPAVGDMYITGTVNIGGFMEFLILQSTRLGIVMKMSEIISNGIHYGLWKVLLNGEMEDTLI